MKDKTNKSVFFKGLIISISALCISNVATYGAEQRPPVESGAPEHANGGPVWSIKLPKTETKRSLPARPVLENSGGGGSKRVKFKPVAAVDVRRVAPGDRVPVRAHTRRLSRRASPAASDAGQVEESEDETPVSGPQVGVENGTQGLQNSGGPAAEVRAVQALERVEPAGNPPLPHRSAQPPRPAAGKPRAERLEEGEQKDDIAAPARPKYNKDIQAFVESRDPHRPVDFFRGLLKLAKGANVTMELLGETAELLSEVTDKEIANYDSATADEIADVLDELYQSERVKKGKLANPRKERVKDALTAYHRRFKVAIATSEA